MNKDIAFDVMSKTALDACIANRHLARDNKELYERNVYEACADRIVAASSEERPYLMEAFLNCFRSELRPGTAKKEDI